jgi:transcription initiation factor TFIID TATA-box-binding protein
VRRTGAQYEPDIFPAAIYSMRSPALRAIVFVSGKVVLTGAKARRHAGSWLRVF